MSARQVRKARRAAEREARKLAEKQQISEAKLAANRANAQKSSGPRSDEGKSRSSRNSFKHGLYSKQLVLPGEDPAELDQLKADLFAEHQPSGTTEELLVNEMAEQYWRIPALSSLRSEGLGNPGPGPMSRAAVSNPTPDVRRRTRFPQSAQHFAPITKGAWVRSYKFGTYRFARTSRTAYNRAASKGSGIKADR